MKTSANNKKIREIINLVREGKLIPRPEFQRRLIWTRNDKNHFIDTILKGFPFPEIYIADGEVDLETGQGTQLLVDGLQRVNTIVQYFTAHPDLKLTTVPAYNDLRSEEKQGFLQYDVAVRDLGSISRDEIIEVFQRLNATKYSLLDIEISNAVYSGALKKFADTISENRFFQDHSVFNAADYKRMGDLRFSLSIICTFIAGYFNRDDLFQELLERYNDDFPLEQEIKKRIDAVFSFINECNFDNRSRIWRKADLYTFIIELDLALHIKGIVLQPSTVITIMDAFLSEIGDLSSEYSLAQEVYYKSALQATNDKISRLRRGFIIGGLLEGKDVELISDELQEADLI